MDGERKEGKGDGGAGRKGDGDVAEGGAGAREECAVKAEEREGEVGGRVEANEDEEVEVTTVVVDGTDERRAGGVSKMLSGGSVCNDDLERISLVDEPRTDTRMERRSVGRREATEKVSRRGRGAGGADKEERRRYERSDSPAKATRREAPGARLIGRPSNLLRRAIASSSRFTPITRATFASSFGLICKNSSSRAPRF